MASFFPPSLFAVVFMYILMHSLCRASRDKMQCTQAYRSRTMESEQTNLLPHIFRLNRITCIWFSVLTTGEREKKTKPNISLFCSFSTRCRCYVADIIAAVYINFVEIFFYSTSAAAAVSFGFHNNFKVWLTPPIMFLQFFLCLSRPKEARMRSAYSSFITAQRGQNRRKKPTLKNSYEDGKQPSKHEIRKINEMRKTILDII